MSLLLQVDRNHSPQKPKQAIAHGTELNALSSCLPRGECGDDLHRKYVTATCNVTSALGLSKTHNPRLITLHKTPSCAAVARGRVSQICTAVKSMVKRFRVENKRYIVERGGVDCRGRSL